MYVCILNSILESASIYYIILAYHAFTGIDRTGTIIHCLIFKEFIII